MKSQSAPFDPKAIWLSVWFYSELAVGCKYTVSVFLSACNKAKHLRKKAWDIDLLIDIVQLLISDININQSDTCGGGINTLWLISILISSEC